LLRRFSLDVANICATISYYQSHVGSNTSTVTVSFRSEVQSRDVWNNVQVLMYQLLIFQ